MKASLLDTALLIPIAMLAVHVLRTAIAKFGKEIPKKLLPWLSVAVAVAAQVGMLEGSPSRNELIDAAIAGLVASGMWAGGANAPIEVVSRSIGRVVGRKAPPSAPSAPG